MILMIDQDYTFMDLVHKFFGNYGYMIRCIHSAEDGFQEFTKKRPDMVILGNMTPEKCDLKLCEAIRRHSDVPIILLSDRDNLDEKIYGLEHGADDFLPKTIDLKELLARVQSLLRRSSHTKIRELRFDGLTLNLKNQTTLLEGKPLNLTHCEFELLTLFTQYAGQTIDRDQICTRLNGTEWGVFSRSVDALVSRLRQKLQDCPKRPRYIKTVWGSGYRFVGKPPTSSFM